MSSNLPPGVTTSMLPGNTPAELEAEAMMDTIYDMLLEKHTLVLPDASVDALANDIYQMIGQAYSMGYKDGMCDEQIARLATE